MPIQCLGHDNIFESAFRSCVSLKHMEITDLPKLGFDAYTIFFGFQKKDAMQFPQRLNLLEACGAYLQRLRR